MPIMPWGGGTESASARRRAASASCWGCKRLDRLLEHEPGDLTVTVEAGITFDRLQAALGARGQWLSLDPPDAERATLGGILAANASGPRRHLYGTARDLLIGLTVVTRRRPRRARRRQGGQERGRLRSARSSSSARFGTLGIIVEATFKLRPRPDVDRLVVARFDRLKDAGAAARARCSASDLIPARARAARRRRRCARLGPGRAAPRSWSAFDGIAPSRSSGRCAELGRLWLRSACARAGVLDGAPRDEAWRAARRARRAGHRRVAAVMKWAVLPTPGGRADGAGRAGRPAERPPRGA